MKNRVLSLSLALAMMGGTAGIAHADLLTYFNFNEQTSGAANTATLTSDTPGLQTSTIGSNFTTPTSNVVVFAGTTLNQVAADTTGGAGANGALTFVSNVNNGNSFQFGFSTTGYQGVNLSYVSRKTQTGFTTQTLDYSLDGTNFFNFGSNSTVGTGTNGTVFDMESFDLSSIAAVNNQQQVIFRFTLTGATDTMGNNRFDNIQVNANAAMATPEPETWAMMALGLGALAMFTWKRKKSDGDVAYGGGFAI